MKSQKIEELPETGAAGGPSRKMPHASKVGDASTATLKALHAPSTPVSPTMLPSSKGKLGTAAALPTIALLLEREDEKELERKEKKKKRKEEEKRKKKIEEEGEEGKGGGSTSSTNNPNIASDEILAKQLAQEAALQEEEKNYDFGDSGSLDEDFGEENPPEKTKPLPKTPNSKSQVSMTGTNFSSFSSFG